MIIQETVAVEAPLGTWLLPGGTTTTTPPPVEDARGGIRVVVPLAVLDAAGRAVDGVGAAVDAGVAVVAVVAGCTTPPVVGVAVSAAVAPVDSSPPVDISAVDITVPVDIASPVDVSTGVTPPVIPGPYCDLTTVQISCCWATT